MSAIVAVVFDWAGTMIDFGCQAPVAALRAAFAEKGVMLAEAAARRDMGLAKRDHVRALLAHDDVAEAWRRATGAPPGEADGDALYAALEPGMIDAAAGHSDLIPGAAELAAALTRQGIRIGSTTGYTRAMMAGVLAAAARQGYAPQALVCAGETAEGRPSPLMLWQALIALNAWPAHRCVKVDDAPVGVAEGRNAGCWSVGVAASGNGVGLSLEAWRALSAGEQRALADRAGAELKAAGADFVIDTVADLPAVLARIEARLASGPRR